MSVPLKDLIERHAGGVRGAVEPAPLTDSTCTVHTCTCMYMYIYLVLRLLFGLILKIYRCDYPMAYIAIHKNSCQ